MRRSNVTSNAFRTVGYDPATRTLEIEFHNGRRYAYAGVSTHTHMRMVNADSVGDFFHKTIKNKFKYQELPPLKDTQAKDEEPMA